MSVSAYCHGYKLRESLKCRSHEPLWMITASCCTLLSENGPELKCVAAWDGLRIDL